ncbi:MAG: type II toxin-antitoxin system VapC family toxin [Saprospiraceae bacterium]
MKECLLDTDTISFFIKGNPNVALRMEQYFDHFGYLNLSVVTYYEIKNGLLFRDAHRQLTDFEAFVQDCQILPVTTEIADLAAETYAALRRQNQIIGHTDVLIAATALHHSFAVVTNNQNHFQRIPGLPLDNWV